MGQELQLYTWATSSTFLLHTVPTTSIYNNIHNNSIRNINLLGMQYILYTLSSKA